MSRTAFIIGFGAMGKRHHEILKKLSFNNISIFDIESVVQNLHELGHDVHSVNLLPKKLITLHPDLVIICTNADSHIHYLKMCLEHNIKRILCEKPLCTSLSELSEIKSMVATYADVKIAVNHQMRFIPQYNIIKNIIDSNSMGNLGSINIHAGNFGLAMNAVHYFELFRYLTDSYPKNVWGWLKPQDTQNPRGNQYKDYSGCVRIENDRGQRLYLDCSRNQGHGIFSNYCFEYGQYFMDELSGHGYVSKRMSDCLHFPTSRYAVPSQNDIIDIPKKNITESTSLVIQSLMGNQNNYPNLQDAGMVIQTLIAAIVSSENQHSCIDVNHIQDHYYSTQYSWA